MKQMLKKILAILIVAITIMTNISLGVSSQDSKDLQDKIDKTKDYLIIKKQSFWYELKDDN